MVLITDIGSKYFTQLHSEEIPEVYVTITDGDTKKEVRLSDLIGQVILERKLNE